MIGFLTGKPQLFTSGSITGALTIHQDSAMTLDGGWSVTGGAVVIGTGADIPSSIEIREDISRVEGTVFANPTHIHQVIMNLCTNAYHAMRDKGGVLAVTLKQINLPENLRDGHSGKESANFILLEVSDTGCGMDKAIQARIFEPYFTTKAVDQGTGLGLSVVYGIVNSLNGRLAVSSSPGQGTVMSVYLPLVPMVEKDAPRSTLQNLRGTEHILFVDDEQVIVELGKRALERLGYTVSTRISSQEALQAFHAHPDTYDVVITDYSMAKMTGLDLCREIKLIKPDLPVILITGYSESLTEEKIRAAGAGGLLLKPIIYGELARMMRDLLDKEKTDTNYKEV